MDLDQVLSIIFFSFNRKMGLTKQKRKEIYNFFMLFLSHEEEEAKINDEEMVR